MLNLKAPGNKKRASARINWLEQLPEKDVDDVIIRDGGLEKDYQLKPNCQRFKLTRRVWRVGAPVRYR